MLIYFQQSILTCATENIFVRYLNLHVITAINSMLCKATGCYSLMRGSIHRFTSSTRQQEIFKDASRLERHFFNCLLLS